MLRLPAINTKDKLAPEHHKIFDAIAESRGEVRGPFTMLLHSPELAGRLAHLGSYVRFEGILDNKVKEVLVLAVAREYSCRYEWGMHARFAKEFGVPEATIAAIRDRRNATMPADDRQLVDYAQALIRDHRTDDATVKAIEGRFGAKGAVEVTTTVGYYSMLAIVLNAFDVQPPEGAEVLPD